MVIRRTKFFLLQYNYKKKIFTNTKNLILGVIQITRTKEKFYGCINNQNNEKNK